MKLSIIVAKSRNNVIGKNNDLPWRLSEDLKNFKRITTGHPVIMGRKTFDSMGKPLKDRTNIIITRQKNLAIDGCIVTQSLDEAIEMARSVESNESFIIGGAEIIKQSISLVDKIYLTEIHAEIEGDTFLNPIELKDWKVTDQKDFEKNEKNEYDFSIIEYERN